ncbi:hypothetical protein WJM97_23160 (plasmid) [Okeanomitos corallinicola TIOX110]|uniref:Uncharacterized protein n=1 Tax=Okeanomitos corallinicola TIOX110 TaxID=3133117 RepID=A0ABZ2V1U4_9CYAN
MARCYLSGVSKSVTKVAIASLDEGKVVIPVWLDVIYQGLVSQLPR